MQLKLLSRQTFARTTNKLGVNTMRMRITRDFLMSQLEKRLDQGERGAGAGAGDEPAERT